MLDRIADQRKNFILDCSAVPFFDSTAANVLEGVVRKAGRMGIRIFITGASPAMRRMLFAHGVKPPACALQGNDQERAEAGTVGAPPADIARLACFTSGLMQRHDIVRDPKARPSLRPGGSSGFG